MVTQIRPKVEANIRGFGKVLYVGAPFDESQESLKSSGASIISLRDLAYTKMQREADSSLNTNGSYVMQGSIYVPKSNEAIFVPTSPILSFAQKATEAHRNSREFYADQDEVIEAFEKAKAGSIKVPYGQEPILTTRFGEEALTNWAFDDQAKDYGLFLKENGINEMPVWLVDKSYIDKQDKPFATQLWLRRLGSSLGSGLDGDWSCGSWSLAGDSAVRGVSRSVVSAEGAKPTGEAGRTQKQASVKMPYTSRQVDSALKRVTGVKEGKLPARSLDSVVDFLLRIRKR